MNGQNNFIKNKAVNFSRFVIRCGCFIFFFKSSFVNMYLAVILGLDLINDSSNILKYKLWIAATNLRRYHFILCLHDK
jgi:hypothetical protein